MTKFSILLFLILSTSALIAQENNKFVYCEIFSSMKGMSGKQVYAIDFGQKSELQKDKIYKDEAGKPLIFDSMIDAMNYMAENGWELVQVYVPVEPATRYVLKKKIDNLKISIK